MAFFDLPTCAYVIYERSLERKFGFKREKIEVHISVPLFQWCNKDVRTKKLQLTDLLVSPVHHIMKIPLVIRDIESRTDDMEEKTIITRIHEMKEHSLSKLGTIHILRVLTSVS